MGYNVLICLQCGGSQELDYISLYRMSLEHLQESRSRVYLEEIQLRHGMKKLLLPILSLLF